MSDPFAALFEGIEGLSFRRRSLRQAAMDVSQIQQGVFDSPKKKGPAKSPRAACASSGKPRTGGKPKTGARLIDTSLEDEWKKRKPSQAGGGGGTASASRARPSGGKSTASALPAGGAKSVNPIAAKMKIASGSQAAVVKIASYAAGGSRVNALVQYQSRNGELTLEREDGSKVEGSERLAALAREWTAEEPAREPSNDVLRLVLDVEAEAFRGRGGQVQIQSALRHALPGHRIAWAAEDRPEGTTRIEIVMSAAARKQEGEEKSARIFDNRKSLSKLEDRLDRAFGTETDMDVRGFAHGVEGTARYLTQITRGGTRAVQSMRLNRDGRFTEPTTLIGHDANLKEAKDWKRDLRSREQRDVAHIILSARPGTDKDAFVDAARAMLAREFAGHQYAFALHEDKQHIHVHAVVKMKAETGERLDPYVKDFQRWRETLAEEARERHIPMDAVSRFERSNPPAYKLKDIRRIERGVAPESVRRRVDAVRSGAPHIPTREEGKKRANEVLRGWRAVEAIAASKTFEPALAQDATRLYRADRPGAALTSQPLFTRDRAAAMRMAERTGGSVSYVDVSSAELAALKPSRTDVLNQFVVNPELAATRKSLEQPSATTILQFKNRAEQAVTGAAQREASTLRNDRASAQALQMIFDNMNEQLKLFEDNLPTEQLREFMKIRRRLEQAQATVLAARHRQETKSGSVDRNVGTRGQNALNPTALMDPILATSPQTQVLGTAEKLNPSLSAFSDMDALVKINNRRDREAIRAAMEVASKKWSAITVTGTDRDKELAVSGAVEHGFKIANPGLQDKIKGGHARIHGQAVEDSHLGSSKDGGCEPMTSTHVVSREQRPTAVRTEKQMEKSGDKRTTEGQGLLQSQDNLDPEQMETQKKIQRQKQ